MDGVNIIFSVTPDSHPLLVRLLLKRQLQLRLGSLRDLAAKQERLCQTTVAADLEPIFVPVAGWNFLLRVNPKPKVSNLYTMPLLDGWHWFARRHTAACC